jgi:hypothetical protein
MAEIDPNRHERDAEVAQLRSLGYSLRVIAATVGTSLAGVQRALSRTHKQPVTVAAPLVLWSPDEWPRATTTPPSGDGWQILNALERWRYRMQTGRTDVPIHDDDHQRCCHAYGIDPDWRRDDAVHARPVSMPDAVELDGDDDW